MKQNFTAEEACELYSRLGDWYLKKEEFQTAYGYWNQAGQRSLILSHLNNPQNFRNELIKFTGADEMFDRTPKDALFQYPFATCCIFSTPSYRIRKMPFWDGRNGWMNCSTTTKSWKALTKPNGTGF